MSSEESSVPSTQVCQKLVEDFAACTQTDEALAQFYLQDRDWDLHKSINDYFDHLNSGKRKAVTDDNDSDLLVLFESKTNGPPKSAKVESDVKGIPKKTCRDTACTSGDDLNSFTFITWNIDGIDEKNIVIRTEAVSKIIKEEKAVIVFLQEVIHKSEAILRQNLDQYLFYSGFTDTVDYYTMTLIHKDFVALNSNQIIEFENTSMGRNLLKTRITIGKTSICLLNTHLESTMEFSDARIEQLKEALKQVSNASIKDTVIFGGDLNLRDKELDKMGGLPIKVVDVWTETGSRKAVQYTWDMMRNDNLSFSGSKYKPRCRFDRVYMRESSPATVDAVNFGLVGLQRLKPHVCFPSDHWGIRCLFKII